MAHRLEVRCQNCGAPKADHPNSGFVQNKDGGLKCSTWVGEIAKVEVGVDWAKGSSIAVYFCACGFETGKVAELVEHLKQHGATRVGIDPNFMDEPKRRKG